MLRLFVGIALAPERRLTLSAICLGLPGAKWVDPGNYHVTLRFIGEADKALAADIDLALGRVKAARFSLTIAALGLFGTDAKPAALYAGVEKCGGLVSLQQRVEAALGRAGLPPETRRFQPHVTLARFRGRPPSELAHFIAANNLLREPPFEVGTFSLIRSYLTKSGSIFEDIAEYKLSAASR